MALGFIFRVEHADGTPAEPPTLRAARSVWNPGDAIPLGPRTLRVVAIRDEDADQPPTLIVDDADRLDAA